MADDIHRKNEENKESSIEQLQKRLYARGRSTIRPKRRRRLRGHAIEVQKDWKPESTKRKAEWKIPEAPPKHSLLAWLLIASVVFFVVSFGVSAFLFFSGQGEISPKKIEIVVKGPATIGGGEELSLQIAVTNHNTVPIERADLIIEFPPGTRSSSDVTVPLPRLRRSLGTIPARGSAQQTIRAVLFGKENTRQNIAIKIEYRIKGSNAIFFEDQVYQLTISSSPLTLRVDALENITSGQEVEFVATLTSNSSTVVEDILLVVEYPFGFDFESALPRASFTDNVWELGDIEPEGERTITIRGIVLGEDGEERIFRFASGIQSAQNEKRLATEFITSLKSIFIEKPFLSVELALDRETAPIHVVKNAKTIRGVISWINNLPVEITDAEIEVQLHGNALNKKSVSASFGFYRSIDNSIRWSKETESDLSFIRPGENGSVSFSFASLGLSSGALPQNPEIILEINIKGNRLSDRNVPEKIESSLTRTVKIVTDVFFTPRALYYTGPFQNTGPIPPQAEQETTYTILWTVTNSTNEVSDTSITAKLPQYVRWLDKITPASENIIFNPISRIITWDVGGLDPGSGTVQSSQREVAFQIAFLPSISQINNVPILVQDQVVTAYDQFTQTKITTMEQPLTILLPTDLGIQSEDGKVVP